MAQVVEWSSSDCKGGGSIPCLRCALTQWSVVKMTRKVPYKCKNTGVEKNLGFYIEVVRLNRAQCRVKVLHRLLFTVDYYLFNQCEADCCLKARLRLEGFLEWYITHYSILITIIVREEPHHLFVSWSHVKADANKKGCIALAVETLYSEENRMLHTFASSSGGSRLDL